MVAIWETFGTVFCTASGSTSHTFGRLRIEERRYIQQGIQGITLKSSGRAENPNAPIGMIRHGLACQLSPGGLVSQKDRYKFYALFESITG